MVFREAVPARWIEEVIPIDDAALLTHRSRSE
jgi:hypothetical protein